MTNSAAKIYINRHRTIGEISPLLFGGFAEHMGRCIYEGIYDPASPHADETGLRRDVLAALREQQYTTIRYPGGNFLSGYNWLDGVGPQAQRPRRRELAWQSIETNQFGTNEFIDFCRLLETQPMLGVNMGTGTIQDAANLVEYCNAPVGTYYADLRASHGYREPHNVKYWCVGNEMDGPWQIGHLDVDEYARKAREAAKMMKWHDPSIKLISCGSSNDRMPTYPEWDRVTLETCWEHVDYHSMHYYAGNRDDDSPSYLASAAQFEAFVDTLSGTLRYVKAKRRSAKDVYLSWDEWQVWYKDTSGRGGWGEAPHLSEEMYNLEDALVVAQWLNVFLRKCDVLKIACVAQIVNVISWLHTTTDGLLKQTSFYPFMLMSTMARGHALDLLVQAPQHETKKYGPMPLLDVSASYDEATGTGAVFIVNRSQSEAVVTDLIWQSEVPQTVKEIWQLAGTDVKAANTWQQPDLITAKQISAPALNDGTLTLNLPPLSFTAIQV
ncbi:MAG: alpha-N-arabinofuranosidase [Chloroflexota bacterium]|nr:alpha-N-arabinofuranosidase [Chloroflexota bacterium]